jgi:hypothetical protein
LLSLEDRRPLPELVRPSWRGKRNILHPVKRKFFTQAWTLIPQHCKNLKYPTMFLNPQGPTLQKFEVPNNVSKSPRATRFLGFGILATKS